MVEDGVSKVRKESGKGGHYGFNWYNTFGKAKNSPSSPRELWEEWKVVAGMFGINNGALNSHNTLIFVDFDEFLEALNERYPVFERRFRPSRDNIR